MAEIYRGSSKKVNLDVYGGNVDDGSVSATLTAQSGSIPATPLTLVDSPSFPANNLERYSAYVPIEYTSVEDILTVTWQYSIGNGQEHGTYQSVYDIVTPLIGINEIRQISGYTDAADVADLERRVRYAIQAYTGQNFGLYRDEFYVRGTNDRVLRMPVPAVSIEDGPLRGARVRAGGWEIGTNVAYTSQLAYSMPPYDILRPGANAFKRDAEYYIKGIFGYRGVPADVQQAARMLTADYACDESLWRDRFINSVRSGNWRFEMNERAFQGTGNVLVDQILAPYRRITMAML